MPGDRPAAVADKPIESTQPRSLYEACLVFAEANRDMLENVKAGSGHLPVLLTWNEAKHYFRAYFGFTH